MSDHEGVGGGSSLDDDLSLPKATVAKMISGACLSFHFSSGWNSSEQSTKDMSKRCCSSC